MSKAAARVATRDIHYSVDEGQSATALHGYFAVDAAQEGERPGVIVVHEWWGLNDYIRRRTEQLAEAGYAALALDMYGDGRVAADADEASTLMSATLGNLEYFEGRLRAGIDTLAAQPEVDAERLGGMGYCFGGATVLNAMRVGTKLRGVVSFHGSLQAAMPMSQVEQRAKVLVCHGAADKLVPDADVAAFEKEMQDADVDYEFVAYDGALHGFTNPEADDNAKKYGLPLGYQAKADVDSWQAMCAFFDRAL